MKRLRRSLVPLVVVASLLPAPSAASEPGWVWPLRGAVLTPYRNGGDPYAGGQHRGIDIAGRVGDPVVAAAAGRVRFAGRAGSSGLTVGVRTADGRYDTSYLHLSAIEARAGSEVRAGQRIGRVGTSGRRSIAAPHLHFGVRDAGTRHGYRDPLELLPPLPAPDPARPRGAPAPAPVAVRPAPVNVPRLAPSPRAAPAPRPAPARRPAPAGRSAPALEPVPAARRLPTLHPAPAAHGLRSMPEGAARPRPAGASAAAREAPAAGPRALARPAAPPAHPERRAAAPRPGPDLGLALACLGVLAAAALVGGSEEGRAAAGPGCARLTALLRPLAGRG